MKKVQILGITTHDNAIQNMMMMTILMTRMMSLTCRSHSLRLRMSLGRLQTRYTITITTSTTAYLEEEGVRRKKKDEYEDGEMEEGKERRTR